MIQLSLKNNWETIPAIKQKQIEYKSGILFSDNNFLGEEFFVNIDF